METQSPATGWMNLANPRTWVGIPTREVIFPARSPEPPHYNRQWDRRGLLPLPGAQGFDEEVSHTGRALPGQQDQEPVTRADQGGHPIPEKIHGAFYIFPGKENPLAVPGGAGSVEVTILSISSWETATKLRVGGYIPGPGRGSPCRSPVFLCLPAKSASLSR